MDSWLANAPFAPQAHRVVRDDRDGAEYVEIIRLWPRPDAARRNATTGEWTRWTPTLHHHFLEHPMEDDEEARHVGDFWDWDIDVMELLRIVPKRVRGIIDAVSYHDYWPSLLLLHAVPDIADIFTSAPVLGAALARWVAEATDEEAALQRIREGLRKPRQRLLGLLDLPEERWALQVVSKLGVFSLDDPGLDSIRSLLKTDDPRIRKLLCHLPVLREDVLSMLLQPAYLAMTTHSLLEERGGCIFIALDIYLHEIAVGRRDGYAPLTPARFRSRAEVLAAYLALDPDAISSGPLRWDPADYRREFGAPAGDVVLAGEPEVSLHPLTSSAAMQSWGAGEALCVPTRRQYPAAASAGLGSMYAVRFQEHGREVHGTLWLQVNGGGGYDVAEFKLTSNADVPSWLCHRVGEWCRGLQARAGGGGALQAGTPSDPP